MLSTSVTHFTKKDDHYHTFMNKLFYINVGQHYIGFLTYSLILHSTLNVYIYVCVYINK